MRPRLEAMLRSKHAPLLVLLAVGLLVGVVLADDFGISWDEAPEAQLGKDAVEAYLGDGATYLAHGELLAHHGPAYFMLFSTTSRVISALFPSWELADGRHLTNFAAFLLGVGSFYLLALRFFARGTAVVVTVIFATQPLLFGHAFINHKDIPFLSLFLATVVAGLAAGDGLGAPSGPASGGQERESGRSASAALREDWASSGTGRRTLLGILVLLSLVCLLDLFFLGNLNALMRQAVTMAYAGAAPEPLNRLFVAVATDAYKTGLDAYLDKVQWLYWSGRVVSSWLWLMLGLGLFAALFPKTFSAIKAKWGSTGWRVLLTGALLGLLVAVRPVGLFAGVLVTLVWVIRARRRAVLPLILCWALAGAIVYSLWPYLWGDPAGRFLESLKVAADPWSIWVLFEGQAYGSRHLPWFYLPRLLSLQLTEPVLFLLAMGLVMILLRLRKRHLSVPDFGVLVLWIVIPFASAVLFGMGLYGTFRHILFVLPPLLLICGFAIEAALDRRISPALAAAGLAVILLPSAVALVRLHPYEYVYFNSIEGGVEGAYGRYDLDYWCTSYREAMTYVNGVASEGDTVAVYGPVRAAQSYARPDLVVQPDWAVTGPPDWRLVCERGLFDPAGREDMERVFEVRHGRAVFAAVYQRSPRTGEAQP